MTGVSLRPALASDAKFLFALMKAALGPYLVATFGPWDEGAQRQRFFSTLKLEHHQIIEHAGERIGCLDCERLGFVVVGEIETHFLMERAASPR
ncbi:MAG: hypothetical protein FJ091_07960 [Deltaproteobacteria bacterium]|nr:hypothetical protein [Deltaproteobacteria bacterium]